MPRRGVPRAADDRQRAFALPQPARELASWERLLAGIDGDVYALVNNAARTEFRSFWEVEADELDDVLAGLSGLELVLLENGFGLEPGAGVAAAQRAFAEAVAKLQTVAV